MSSEFDLIRRHFTHPVRHTLLGVGDDAALFAVRPGQLMAASTDMLVSGRHFFPDTDPERLGHKALAVNLSDLAAMGATPRWALLAIALPDPATDWLAAFARGFLAEAQRHGVDWVGGDTTAGPLNLSVTILGEVPAGQALQRNAAQPGDQIWVSGSLGDAAVGLACLQGRLHLPDAARAHCLQRLEWPTPRVALGQALLGLAHAAIDVSDGLLADLGHILDASAVGAELIEAQLPCSGALLPMRSLAQVAAAMLGGGDDYELCFTAPAAAQDRILAAAARCATPVRRIGHVTQAPGIRLLDASGQALPLPAAGFDHFATDPPPALALPPLQAQVPFAAAGAQSPPAEGARPDLQRPDPQAPDPHRPDARAPGPHRQDQQ